MSLASRRSTPRKVGFFGSLKKRHLPPAQQWGGITKYALDLDSDGLGLEDTDGLLVLL